MPAPSYGGVQCFGDGYYSVARPNPPRSQWNRFNGIDGRERLHLGADGGTVEFEFLASAADLATLAAYEATWQATAANGGAAVLIDTLGNNHGLAVLMLFEPVEPVEPDGFGRSARTYRALFEVL